MKKRLLSLVALGLIVGVIGWEAFLSPKVLELSVSRDFDPAMDLSEMEAEAAFIVIGEYTGFDRSQNAYRVPGDIMTEDDTQYARNDIYNFQIDQVLRGEIAEDTIQLSHRVSRRVKYEPDSKDSFELPEPTYIEPQIGTKYMLFLKNNEPLGLYFGAIQPFSIIINEDNTVTLNSNIVDPEKASIVQDFPVGKSRYTVRTDIGTGITIPDTISGRTLDDILNQIL